MVDIICKIMIKMSIGTDGYERIEMIYGKEIGKN